MAKSKSDVVPLLNEIGFKLDDEMVKVIGLLEGKGAVAELDIAEALGVKINSARKLLYRLNSLNIAIYSKKRDEEKKWWYIYFWTLDDRRIKDLFLQKKANLLKVKKEELETERKNVFSCDKCSARFEYEHALDSDFMCSNCDEDGMLVEISSNKVINGLTKEIAVLEKEIDKFKNNGYAK